MDHQVDISALMECNVTWKQIDPKLLPQEQTKLWWENSHWSITHKWQDPDVAPYQPSGMGILVVNQLSYRAQHPGDDTIRLDGGVGHNSEVNKTNLSCVVSTHCTGLVNRRGHY